MKNGLARALAIIALIFMVLFLAALTATIIDHKLLNGSVGYITIGLGVFVLMIFLALKADGRGFSITKMNNEIEMKKIEDEFEAQRKKEEEQKAAQAETTENTENADGAESSGIDEIARQAESASAENAEPDVENIAEVSADEKLDADNPKSGAKNKSKKKKK